MNKIQEINDLVKTLYKTKKYKELEALSMLFSESFLDKLENILNKNCRNEEAFKDYYIIDFGWIDKIPLASFTGKVTDYYGNLIENKVEIGDLLLISNHSQVHQDKFTMKENWNMLDSRALIVLAKVVKNMHLNVPIEKLDPKRVTSTSKELALLSNWPEFDLFKSS